MEKDVKGSSSALGKAKDSQSALGKAKGTSAALEKAVVVVDGHNTLEVNEDVPGPNMTGLNQLLSVAQVHILSYVGTAKRKKEVEVDMASLPQYWNLSGCHTTFNKHGLWGKASWCEWLGATTIFDDTNSICQECLGKGIKVYAIRTAKEDHSNLDPSCVFDTFVEAVTKYLADNS